MDIPVLKVEQRKDRGKKLAAQLRQQGRIPAVCYGKEKQPLPISLDPDELLEILRGPRGLNSLIKLEGTEDDRTVFVQDVQKHPVERNLLHIDFIHVDPNRPIERKVPVELVGKPEGVKLGGILQVTRREILVETLPATIPDKVEIDVESLLVGQSIHVEDITFAEGVKAIYDRNYAICAVVAPTEEKEEEVPEEGLEAAEGEAVEGEGAPAEGKEGEEKKPGAEKKEEGADAKK
jgi:large subunit ribosomal protein L25